MPLTELEMRQLQALVEPLLSRLLATEPHDFSALARRGSADTDSLIEYLWGCREQYAPELLTMAKGPESGLRFVTARFVSWALEKNQFFDFDEGATRRFVAAHRILLREVGAALTTCQEIGDFAQRANRALLRFVERLARVFRPLGFSSVLGQGSEYSAELQLRVLGLEPERLLGQVVLDLGCGKTADLVQLLRGKGVAATGLDRNATGPFVVARDWFDVSFEPTSVGTIVSHLAFSLHFLHHHWRPGERAYAYARKYMELLASLKPGGSFIYTPGLPFIECLLDESKYRVQRRSLPQTLASLVESLRDLGTGQSVGYVTEITRL